MLHWVFGDNYLLYNTSIMVKFNVLMGKHLNVVGVLQEDLSLVGAVCQNHGKGTVNWKGRLDTHKGWKTVFPDMISTKMEPNVFKKFIKL